MGYLHTPPGSRPNVHAEKKPGHSGWRKTGLLALIIVWAALTLDLAWPGISKLANATRADEKSALGTANYLIIAPQALSRVARAWSDYRTSTGYHTEVALLPPAQAELQVVQGLVQMAYAKSEPGTSFYVLLLGHAHPSSSHPESFLPAAYFSVDTSRFPGYGEEPIPSDDIFARDLYDSPPDQARPILLGRIPVRTEAEGFRLLERTRAYEQTPPADEGRARIELVASNAGFGPQYDPLFELALRILTGSALPDEYEWHMLYGNAQSPYSYPSHSFPQEVARRFDSRALALVYIGHGQPDLLAWAHSPNGERGRIFGMEDVPVIQHADATIGIFTACSAGKYDGKGDEVSIVEAIFLSTGGPVATYASSAWINGTANGRLIIDALEALLLDKAPTLGQWAEQTEGRSAPPRSPVLMVEVVKSLIPRFSGLYHGRLMLSASEASKELDIQHATYNLFGDPALRIAYPQEGIELSPLPLWLPQKRGLSLSGSTDLPAGQPVSLFLEGRRALEASRDFAAVGTIDRYQQENSLELATANTFVGPNGTFTGALTIPPGTPGGKYLLRAISVEGRSTYVSARPVYIGWAGLAEIISVVVYGWLAVTAAVLCGIKQSARLSDP